MKYESKNITRAIYEKNLAEKLSSPRFNEDIKFLLQNTFSWNMQTAAAEVKENIIALLPGETWQGSSKNN